MSEEPNTPIDAAVAEAENKDQKVNVLGKEFTLTKGFTTAAAYHLDKAQKEESLSGLVEAFAKIIDRKDRDSFLEHVLSEPEDGEEVSLDDFFTLFTDAVQKVTGRPLDTSTS